MSTKKTLVKLDGWSFDNDIHKARELLTEAGIREDIAIIVLEKVLDSQSVTINIPEETQKALHSVGFHCESHKRMIISLIRIAYGDSSNQDAYITLGGHPDGSTSLEDMLNKYSLEQEDIT